MDRAMTSDEYSIDQMTTANKAACFDAKTFMLEANQRMIIRLSTIRGEEIAEDSNFMKSMSSRMSACNERA